MFLGIEIGGTKLQFGVGAGDGTPLVCLARREVDPSAGAAGILEQIREETSKLKSAHSIQGIGVGFGGPVDALKAGCARATTSQDGRTSLWSNGSAGIWVCLPFWETIATWPRWPRAALGRVAAKTPFFT